LWDLQFTDRIGLENFFTPTKNLKTDLSWKGERTMRKIKPWILVILSLAVASLACSTLSGGEDATPTPIPADQSDTVDQDTPPEVDPTDEPQDDAGDSEIAELNAATLWDQSTLTSYRAEYSITFDGFSGAESIQGTIGFILELTSEPPAQHVVMHLEGLDLDLEGLTSIEIFIVDGVTYTNFGDEGGWMTFPGSALDEMTEAFTFPQDILDLPPTASRKLLPERVNGVSAWHYELDENDFADDSADFEALQADAWVAVDGGFLVKLDATLSGAYTGTTIQDQFLDEGTIQMVFNMLDVNQPFTIELPPEAADAIDFSLDGLSLDYEWTREDIPLPPDATIDFATETLVSFASDLTIEETAEYFMEQLLANGWSVDGEPFSYEGGYSANFVKGTESLSLIVAADLIDPQHSTGVITLN
jgi:hypothetical protein